MSTLHVELQQIGFTAGIVDEGVFLRSDLKQAGLGLKDCLNWGVSQQGKLYCLPGTEVLKQLGDEVWGDLFGFFFEPGDEVLLHFTDLAVDVYSPIAHGLTELVSTVTTEWAEEKGYYYHQINNDLYVSEETSPIQKLVRLAEDDWEVQDIEFYNDSGFVCAPQYKFDADSVQIKSSANTGSGVTLTASEAIFLDAHVGSSFRFAQGEVEVTAVPGGGEPYTTCTGNVTNALTGGTAFTEDYTENAFSAARGYPAGSGLIYDRFVYFGHPLIPNKLFISRADWFDNFLEHDNDASSTVTLSHGLVLPLYGTKFTRVFWIELFNEEYFVGASSGVWRIDVANSNEGFGAGNALPRPTSSVELANKRAVVTSDSLVFVGLGNRKIWRLYKEGGAWETIDITQTAPDLFEEDIEQIFYKEEPIPQLWVRMQGGSFNVLTFIPKQDFYAWTRYELGGPNPTVQDVAVLRGTDAESDIYMLTGRPIVGGTDGFIERTFPIQAPIDLVDEHCWLSGATYVDLGAGADTIGGLDDWEGTEFYVVMDGVISDQPILVMDGVMALGQTVQDVFYGYDREERIDLIDKELQTQKNSTLGRMKNYGRAVLWLQDYVGNIKATVVGDTEDYVAVDDDVGYDFIEEDYRVVDIGSPSFRRAHLRLERDGVIGPGTLTACTLEMSYGEITHASGRNVP